MQKKSHGIFYGNPEVITNKAWANRGNIKPISGNGVDIYHIPYDNSGYTGGFSGQGQNLSHVTIIIKQGTNSIITAYPSFGN